MVRVALRRGGEVGLCTRLAGEGLCNGGDICRKGGEGEGRRNGKVSGAGTSMTVGGFEDGVCCRAGGSTELKRLELEVKGSATDIREVKANKTRPHSFSGVVVHSVCYGVHRGESKERRSLLGRWVCSRKE